MYRLMRGSNSVIRVADGVVIPADDRNGDFIAFKQWRDGWTEIVPNGNDLDGKEPGTAIVHPPNVPLPADPAPAPSKDQTDAAAALAYPKLAAMANMSPAEVGKWVDDNVNTLLQAKDAIRTLAIAVSVLARQIR